MQKIRIKYRKGEEVKYLSHLDLMRAVHRAVRRAGLPITYSQGFNPHMKISWGKALKVGQASNEEYAEIHLEQLMPPKEIMDRLNATLPSGIEIRDAFLV